jgi:MOSC domain-containing protein YiiM
MKTSIKSIATGVAQNYDIKDKNFSSAYKKNNFLNTCKVATLGLQNDFQVDKRFHGGIDKAIHIGSSKHFQIFKELYKKEMEPLSIGCNIVINDYDESDIFVGDVYCLGDVKLEVSQPRQPCWKIGALFGKDISRYIVKNQATGWYVRVLNEGMIDITDKLILEKRVSDFSIKDLSIYLHTPPENHTLIQKILHTKSLADSYKQDLLKVLESNNS